MGSGRQAFQTGPYLSRADVVPGVPIYPTNRSINQWVNPAAFSLPPDNIGRFGTSPVGAGVGPGTQVVSLTLPEAVDLALEQNSDLTIIREKIREDRFHAKGTRADELPQIKTAADDLVSPRTQNLKIPAGALGIYPGVGPCRALLPRSIKVTAISFSSVQPSSSLSHN